MGTCGLCLFSAWVLSHRIKNLPRQAQKDRKEMVLFNYAFNTFYIWLHGIRPMVKDHSDRDRGNLLLLHGLFLALLYASSHRQDNTVVECRLEQELVFFYMHHPTDSIVYHGVCYTSCGALAGTRNRPMVRSNDPSHHEQTLLPPSYISLRICQMKTHTQQQIKFIYKYLLVLSCWGGTSSVGPPWRIDLMTHCTTELHFAQKSTRRTVSLSFVFIFKSHSCSRHSIMEVVWTQHLCNIHLTPWNVFVIGAVCWSGTFRSWSCQISGEKKIEKEN